MEKLLPPKILKWNNTHLERMYNCDYDLLISSGCSFTASTNTLKFPETWPGYVIERCNIDSCMDMSWHGMGNLYIKESIEYALQNKPKDKKPLVIIMWSGLDRVDNISYNNSGIKLGNKFYKRENAKDRQHSIEQSIDNILYTKKLLESENIDFVFTSFVNLIKPPYIRGRDGGVKFTDLKNKNKLKLLDNVNFVPESGMDYFFEWTFINDYFDDDTDYFHPPKSAQLDWTDKILLPNLENLGFVQKLKDTEL